MRKLVRPFVEIMIILNVGNVAGNVVGTVLRHDTFSLGRTAHQAFIFFCASLLLSLLVLPLARKIVRWRWRRARASRCEFCRAMLDGLTDDMRWTERYGLVACDACSVKIRLTFGGTPAQDGADLVQ